MDSLNSKLQYVDMMSQKYILLSLTRYSSHENHLETKHPDRIQAINKSTIAAVPTSHLPIPGTSSTSL